MKKRIVVVICDGCEKVHVMSHNMYGESNLENENAVAELLRFAADNLNEDLDHEISKDIMRHIGDDNDT